MANTDPGGPSLALRHIGKHIVCAALVLASCAARFAPEPVQSAEVDCMAAVEKGSPRPCLESYAVDSFDSTGEAIARIERMPDSQRVTAILVPTTDKARPFLVVYRRIIYEVGNH